MRGISWLAANQLRSFSRRTLHHGVTKYCPLWPWGPTQAMASSFLRFLDHAQRRITVGRTPLDEWSARCRDLYLTTHNNHNRQTSMLTVGFEPTVSGGERPQIYALDLTATGTGYIYEYVAGFTFRRLYTRRSLQRCPLDKMIGEAQGRSESNNEDKNICFDRN